MIKPNNSQYVYSTTGKLWDGKNVTRHIPIQIKYCSPPPKIWNAIVSAAFLYASETMERVCCVVMVLLQLLVATAASIANDDGNRIVSSLAECVLPCLSEFVMLFYLQVVCRCCYFHVEICGVFLYAEVVLFLFTFLMSLCCGCVWSGFIRANNIQMIGCKFCHRSREIIYLHRKFIWLFSRHTNDMYHTIKFSLFACCSI